MTVDTERNIAITSVGRFVKSAAHFSLSGWPCSAESSICSGNVRAFDNGSSASRNSLLVLTVTRVLTSPAHILVLLAFQPNFSDSSKSKHIFSSRMLEMFSYVSIIHKLTRKWIFEYSLIWPWKRHISISIWKIVSEYK